MVMTSGHRLRLSHEMVTFRQVKNRWTQMGLSPGRMFQKFRVHLGGTDLADEHEVSHTTGGR